MEKQKKIRLKGHESFMVRDGWLHKGILAVSENPNVFAEFMGADALGVGSNMAKSIRYWMKAFGLTFEVPRKGTYLTELGKLILEKDSYFEEDFTLWIMHLQLLLHKEDATVWHLFFNELIAEEFSREELYHLLKHAMNHYVKEETYSEKSLESDCTVLLNMYVKERQTDFDPEDKSVSPFSVLGLIRRERKKYKKQQPDLERLEPLVVFISILILCQDKIKKTEEKSRTEQEIKIEEKKEQERIGIYMEDLLKKANGPGKALNLNRTVLNFYLDRLCAQDYLDINRTAGLDMVYLKPEAMDMLTIIKQYYASV